jgi:hypothetical protein
MKGKARKLLGLLLILWLTSSTAGFAEEVGGFRFKAGLSYEEGDFGTDVTTKTLLMPFTVQYLGRAFDLSLTVPYIDQETSASVTVVDGRPVRIRKKDETVIEKGVPRRADTVRRSASGLGDIVLKGRLFLLSDAGPTSPLPAVTPFYQVKFPTADEDEGLGTGELDHGFGLELDKAINDFFLFAHVGYTFIGEPPGTDLRNRFSAGGGAGVYLTRDLSASVSVVWKQSLVKGSEDPTDLFFDVAWRIYENLSLNPFASIGLTEGSPDYGVGFQVSYSLGQGSTPIRPRP